VTLSPRAWLREFAPWLLEEDLGACVVGSTALRTACERAGVEGPTTADLDMSWALDVDRGIELLQRHDVWMKTTDASQRRGTLAMKLDDTRIEITTFRVPSSSSAARGESERSMADQIADDLAGRDMTLGAVAHWLAEDRIVDPFGGLDAWREKRIAPVGDPAARIEEHPIRWIRYYRRSHQWGFELDAAIRAVDLDPRIIEREPAEAIGGELRAALLECASPGEFLRDLYDNGLLEVISPELASQFDGRAAGPLKHHPEGSQANHMILALEWIADRAKDLPERDRLTATVAVLCHDLGKGLTPEELLPAHHGHELSGIEPLRALLDRYPGLTDPAGKRLAEAVCTLHLTIRQLDELRPGTRARLYERNFRDKNFRADLFALAVGADSGGRMDKAREGDEVARTVRDGIEWMQSRCATIDVGALYETHKDDKERFKSELHQAWARVLKR
jgi:tRNA nucleotidyltransferase/poly(A) polymerase